jgi:glycosyltransferase involved in cell wall biosynthesis
MKTPEISVVMGVYNGAGNLAATLESILTQDGCDFEFIVVNDGSTDSSGRILDDWAARDNRLRVIHQENTGLTKALIRGCAAARGDFIARQDAGDISLPGRLLRQSEYLRSRQDVVLVACSVSFLGPLGEKLYDAVQIPGELEKGLSCLDVRKIKGPPHHGGTMFRRDAYFLVGGYRSVFVVAQDIDLWLRLSECGRCMAMEEILYQAKWEAGSISSRRRTEQFRVGTLAIECAKRRRCGLDDFELLQAYKPRISTGKQPHFEKARFYYFIASLLRQSDPVRAKHYYRQAVREYPFFLKAIIRSIWV